MAWIDVPAKLVTYALETYAPRDADITLLRQYDAVTVDGVPEHRREDFERDLDYRLGACQNLKTSRAKRWQL